MTSFGGVLVLLSFWEQQNLKGDNSWHPWGSHTLLWVAKNLSLWQTKVLLTWARIKTLDQTSLNSTQDLYLETRPCLGLGLKGTTPTGSPKHRHFGGTSTVSWWRTPMLLWTHLNWTSHPTRRKVNISIHISAPPTSLSSSSCTHSEWWNLWKELPPCTRASK